MPTVQIIGVVVRLFAVWLASWGLRTMPTFWIYNSPDVSFSMRMYVLITAVVMLLIAALLWTFPLTVAGKLVPGGSSTDHPTLSVEQLETTGAALLGIWVLIDAVPNCGYAIVAFSMRSAPLDGNAYTTIVRLILEIGIGVWLLFGANDIFRFVRFARGRA